jgi:hypothetical protein
VTGPETAPTPADGPDVAAPAQGDAAEAPRPARLPARPSWRSVGGWLVLVGAAVALDGPVGGLALVFVAAVLLAGLSPRIVGGVGVALLVLAPLAVILEGLPSESQVSPAFVSRSLLPHHLTFAGLVLVSAYALIDLIPHLRAWAAGAHPAPAEGPPLGTALGVAITALVAIGAVAACAAVLVG